MSLIGRTTELSDPAHEDSRIETEARWPGSRWIIQATPHKKTSRGQRIKSTCNNVQELSKLLKHKTDFEKRLIAEKPETE